MKQVDQLMEEGLSREVFPGAVLLVSREGRIVFHKAFGYANLFTGKKMMKTTIFDLASLTKPLATTSALMHLCRSGMIQVDDKIGEHLSVLKGTDKAEIRIKNLLLHDSGLPDYRSYFLELIKYPKETRREKLREFLVRETLQCGIGEKVQYSDLGFMFLSWLIEEKVMKRLDVFLCESVYHPLGIKELFFLPGNRGGEKTDFAATEFCFLRKKLISGAVHDENAYMAGGVEGHAGLFGTAEAVHSLLMVFLEGLEGNSRNGVFSRESIKNFLAVDKKKGRALGFDAPSSSGSSSGRLFGKESVGHLGFSGTSFWMDPERGVIVILLTNRIHPSRKNIRIRSFRPLLHDLVMEKLCFHSFPITEAGKNII